MRRKMQSGEAAWMGAAAVVCVMLLAAGCAESGMVPPPPPGPPPISATLQVCNSTPSGCAAGASYSLETLRDLNISVSWKNVPAGTHVQTLEVLEPDGGLYVAKTLAFAIDEGADGSSATTETVPVAGTWIITRLRTGVWTVRISLDSEILATQTVQFDP
ncbi:MAG: hypothetical protein ACREVR_04220 [Burkholderiales bacterium]